MLKIKPAFERLKNVLRKINPNLILPDEFFDYLWNYMEEFTPDPDEPLVKQGSTPKYAYFIIRGFVSVFYHDENGTKLVKRFYGEDCIAALLSFLEQLPSPYTLVAGKDALLSRIGIKQMEYIYENWKGMKEFAQLTVMRHEENEKELRDKLLRLPGEQRVLAFYQEFRRLLHSKTFTDSDIASYLCMQRETLSLLRKELINKKLLPEKE